MNSAAKKIGNSLVVNCSIVVVVGIYLSLIHI